MTRNRLFAALVTPALALTLLPAALAQRQLTAAPAAAQRKARPAAPATDADVSAAVGRAFGAEVEAVTGFRPFFLSGDFNSDGAQDLLAVVRLKSGRRGVPAGVRVLSPFGYLDAGDGGPLALAIIHGGAGGWRASEPAAKFLLHGGSPVLILQESRLSEPDAVKDLMELVARADARKRRGLAYMKMPAGARGDWVLVGTEATEALIYWDGKTYRYKESPEGY